MTEKELGDPYRSCGDPWAHQPHEWIDKSQLPMISAWDPIPAQDATIEIRKYICRGVNPLGMRRR